jgi:all-trans-8'-apo-beta-carotenal 15,15'-oxygenase
VMRRPFTNLPGRLGNVFNLKLGNTAVHDAYAWGGSIVASDVPGHYLLDPATLATRGPAPINALMKIPGSGAPMPRVDPATGRLLVYFVKPGLTSSTLLLKEFDGDWKEVKSVTATIAGPGSFLHDAAYSPRWAAIAELGVLNPLKAVAGGATLYDALNPGKKGLRLLVIDREKGGQAHEIPIGGRQAFHIPNLWEDGDAVEFHTPIYEGVSDFRFGYPPGMERPGPAVNLAASQLVLHRYVPATKEYRATPVQAPSIEAPLVNPRFFGKKNAVLWGPTPGSQGDEEAPGAFFWYHGLARIDLAGGKHQVWDAGPRTYVSPPAFAQKPGTTGEDEGWLLAWTIDAAAQKSGVVVLDAGRVDQGPIAKAALEVLLPVVSHTDFIS